MSLQNQITAMAMSAKKASLELALIPTKAKNEALGKMAHALLSKTTYLKNLNNPVMI